MSSGKKKLIALFLVLLAIAVPASVYLVMQQQEIRGRAEPATTLSFEPTSLSKTVGEVFTLTINIDTGSNNVSGAELHLQYDSSRLSLVSFDIAPTPFLPVLSQSTTPSGLAFMQLLSQPSQPRRGTGSLATITFRATASTAGAPTFVRFTTQTAVAGTNEATNVLASQPAPAQITIGGAITPTVTPSTTPVPTTGQPTPTPRITSGAGGGGTGGAGGTTLTPTPTRIATGSAGATGSATPTAIAKGGLTVAPTAATIPVTAEIGPTTAIALGGIVLTVLGVVSLFAL